MQDELYQEELYAIPGRVMVVLSLPWQSIADGDKTLLGKILGSVKLSLAHVQIISGTGLTPEQLQAYSPQKILIFGKAMQSQHSLYENFTAGPYPAIAADELSQLDDAKKKSLWIAMKQLFKL